MYLIDLALLAAAPAPRAIQFAGSNANVPTKSAAPVMLLYPLLPGSNTSIATNGSASKRPNVTKSP